MIFVLGEKILYRGYFGTYVASECTNLNDGNCIWYLFSIYCAIFTCYNINEHDVFFRDIFRW